MGVFDGQGTPVGSSEGVQGPRYKSTVQGFLADKKRGFCKRSVARLLIKNVHEKHVLEIIENIKGVG